MLEFNNSNQLKNKKFRINRRKIGRFIVIGLLATAVLSIAWFFYKTSNVLTITKDAGTYKNFKVEKEPNRIDILILGIGGPGHQGGLLTDSILLLSFDKEKEKAALVGLPRDLFVTMPNHAKPEKINYAYALGESRLPGGGGLALSKEVVKYVTGVYIDHAVVLNFDGFEKLVDIMGGVTISRNTKFVEDKQWQGEGKEDSPFWYKQSDTDNTEQFTDGDTEEVFDENEESVELASEESFEYWVFEVPAGTSVLSGEDALYYVRSRFTSSDFDRIRRQQQVISSLKNKAFSLGVLANPIKVFNILDVIGNNIRTDMGLGDIREATGLAQKYDKIPIETNLLDTSNDGLLISKNSNGSFVLVPRIGDDDFTEIRDFFTGIFD